LRLRTFNSAASYSSAGRYRLTRRGQRVDAIDRFAGRVEKTVIRMHMAGDVDSLRYKMCGAFVTKPIE
jgi:hypothetical protein